MKHKQYFYSQVIKNNPNTEIAKLLQENPDCGYYEVCQSFADVALNALIIQNDDGSLSGVFQYSDIAIAKEKSVAFIRNNSFANVDSFFEILDHEYPSSVAPDDTRRKSGMVTEHNTGYNGYIGTLYFFTHISDNVYANIVAEIKKQLMEEGYLPNLNV